MDKFLFFLQMIPSILALVQQVETMFTDAGQGAAGPAKLNLVLNTVNTAAQAAPEIQKNISANELTTTTTNIVNASVASLNQAGVFKKPNAA